MAEIEVSHSSKWQEAMEDVMRLRSSKTCFGTQNKILMEPRQQTIMGLQDLNVTPEGTYKVAKRDLCQKALCKEKDKLQ